VFLVNSRLGLFTAAPSGFGREVLHPDGAPLLPKLRGNFAEFLNEGFLDRLGILYPPTCVGLGTGTQELPRGFSRGHGFRDFRRNGLGIPSQRWPVFTRPAYTVAPAQPTAGIPCPTPSPHSVERSERGTGISTRCPSPTPVGLGLGPD
jgi:hypothetical protein